MGIDEGLWNTDTSVEEMSDLLHKVGIACG